MSGKSKRRDISVKKNYIQKWDCFQCRDADCYEKMTKIGQGTFGEVFKARSKSDNRFVAMKKILLSNEKDGFPITALREIKILQQLKHRNIVELLEVCRTKPQVANNYCSTIYLVFEFCEHDLAGLLNNVNVKFNLGEIKMIMKQLLEGLYFMHFSNILHRDMKAANILINKDGILKLADFGLARAAKRNYTNYTNRVITLWYRPLELLLGSTIYTTAIDMWGAGCIMAELWTRSPIMQGNSEKQLIYLISQLCGTPDGETWPEIQNLPLYNKIVFPKNQRRKVKERLKPYVKDPYGCDLIDRLLTLDPAKRIDADTALNHDFFYMIPMPISLSTVISKHKQSMFEYNSIKIQSHSTGANQKNEYFERVF